MIRQLIRLSQCFFDRVDRVQTIVLTVSLSVLCTVSTLAAAQTQQVTILADRDVTIWQAQAGNSFNSEPLFVGNSAQAGTSDFYTLLYFDVEGELPSGAVIVDIELELERLCSLSTSPVNFTVFRAGSFWSESTSWNNRPNVFAINPPPTDRFENCSGTPVRSFLEGSAGLIQHYQDVIDQNIPQNGIVLLPFGAGDGDFAVSANAEQGFVPRLKITYEEVPDLVPELRVVSVSTNPSPPVAGESVELRAVIENTGTATTPGSFNLDFFLNQSTCPSPGTTEGLRRNVQQLNAGQTRTITRNTVLQNPGSFTLRAFVDSTNVVTETNEQNNCNTAGITVETLSLASGACRVEPAARLPGQSMTHVVEVDNPLSSGRNVRVEARFDHVGSSFSFSRDSLSVFVPAGANNLFIQGLGAPVPAQAPVGQYDVTYTLLEADGSPIYDTKTERDFEVLATPAEIAIEIDGQSLSDGGTFNFGNAPIGETRTVPVEVSNLGQQTLTLSEPSFTGPFTRTGSFLTSVAPGSTGQFNIRWTVGSGSNEGSMTLPSSDADENPFVVQLAGNAECDAQITTLGIDQSKTIDIDDDGFASQIEVIWQTTIACGEQDLVATLELPNGSTLPVSYTARAGSSNTQTTKVNVSRHIDTTLQRGAYPIGIRLRTAHGRPLQTSSQAPSIAAVSLEPGSDVLNESDRLPNGKWTIIIHGLSDGDYRTLVDDQPTDACDANWPYRLARKIQRESSLDGSGSIASSNVAIYEHDAPEGLIRSLGGSSFLNPNATPPQISHGILIVDWTEVSNYADTLLAITGLQVDRPPAGAQGDDGYAEGTADAIYALLARYQIEGDVHQLIGYSRGAVVATELSQRLNLSATGPEYTVFLDGEGGDLIGFDQITLYSDSRFNAWSDGLGTTDNYLQNTQSADLFLGDTVRDGAANYQTDGAVIQPPFAVNYSHAKFPEYAAGGQGINTVCLPLGTLIDPTGEAGLYLLNQRLTTVHLADRPFVDTSAAPSLATDAPAVDEVYNGDFDIDAQPAPSTAGWWYHGGTPVLVGESTDDLGMIVEASPLSVAAPPLFRSASAYPARSGSPNHALELDKGEFRRHNWMAVPDGFGFIEMNLRAASLPGAGPNDRVIASIEWYAELGDPSPVVVEYLITPGTSSGAAIAIPAEGRAGLLVIRNGRSDDPAAGANAALLVDDIRWGEAIPRVTIGLPQSDISVPRGDSTSIEIVLNRSFADEPIMLSASGVPTGVSVDFDQTIVTGDATGATITTTQAATPGLYGITIDGSAPGTVIDPATLMLEITDNRVAMIAIEESSGVSNDGRLDFPATSTVGSAIEQFTIRNTGSAALDVSRWTIVDVEAFTGGQWQPAGGLIFSVSPENNPGPSGDLQLAPAASSQPISVLFSPAFPVPYRASLEIASSDPALPLVTLSLTGEGFVAPPQSVVNLSPANGASGLTPPITLEWTGGSLATGFDVYAGDSPSLGASDLVAQLSPSADSFSLLTAEQGSRVYWRIDATNSGGTTSGPVWTFLVRSCPADINSDGVLNGADYNGWLQAFANSEPSADQNQDGVLNGADFNAWLQNFANGCP